jgi:hypothetical protein
MKYDVTTSHMFTQHWAVEARTKEDAAKLVMESNMKFDKTTRKYVSNKLAMGLVTIPDAKIMSVEPFETEGLDEPQIDTIPMYEGTDPE